MTQKYKHPRKSNTSTVGEALGDMLKQYHLNERFDQNRLLSSWEKLMGNTIANRTSKIFIKNKVLFVELNSAPLKNELNLSKDKLKSIIEKEIGPGIINEIIIM
ncbi:MAG: DUF721 domain-containing protein [Fulvivirga sp.]|uniref:DUF721 domain-containing protein n=1 Tax=Fulvivirga sp. TaxID=1931237 RepID=UPI0032F04CEE